MKYRGKSEMTKNYIHFLIIVLKEYA